MSASRSKASFRSRGRNGPKRFKGVSIHRTAIVAAESIGSGTRVWAFCNLLPGVRVGRDCNICDRVFIESGVVLGDRVTIKCGVSLWTGVTLGNGVFVGPDATFTNDFRPRSGRHLSEWARTDVEDFASVGAGAILLPVRIGHHALIGAGALVTREVAPFALVVGSPARQVGWACVCGASLQAGSGSRECAQCSRRYELSSAQCRLVDGSPDPVERRATER